MARVSQMFDPLNKMTVDAVIESKDIDKKRGENFLKVCLFMACSIRHAVRSIVYS
ncbi:MAG: hypothetical protein GXP56_10455 [Deltaproteobacteria bacterium]|nr:hypothetical protein [Deltaproteobacteria bacterium]